MNILILYNSTQTYTSTVFEHLASFRNYSNYRVFYCHADPASNLNVDLDMFDAVGIHYSIRLPFDQVSPLVAQALEAFEGLKFLFIQDEYDFPQKTWHWIRKLRINLVFTVVPEAGIGTVYPSVEFPKTRFVTNLTGYVPERLPPTQELPPPSDRTLMIGYRGRPLPIRYGQLGIEKISIAKIVKAYCDQHDVKNDIAWSEEARIYGPKWYDFVVSCRAMLGSESGSNVFDWDGTLDQTIERYRRENQRVSNNVIYRDIVGPREINGLMNQISPKIFEAIALRTVLILFDGEYSGVIRPGEHFIALKKDGSNLADVIRLLKDDAYVDSMTERAWCDVIASGDYSYRSFVGMVDNEIERSISELRCDDKNSLKFMTDASHTDCSTPITTHPIRVKPFDPSTDTNVVIFSGSQYLEYFSRRLAAYIWSKLPGLVRSKLKPPLKRLMGRG